MERTQNIRFRAMIWAAIIIVAALIAVGLSLSTGASFGVVGGLSGSALGALHTGAGCSAGCLQ